MVLLQLTVTRFIQVYIAQGLVFVILITIAFKLILNDPKKLKIILSEFYFIGALGLLINFIYAPINNQKLVHSLNFITNFCIVFSAIFPMLFCLSFYKGDENIDLITIFIILSIYGILTFLMILIPNGVEINESTGWAPQWSILLFIYVLLIMTFGAVIPTIYYALKIHQMIEDFLLKRKWRSFMIGTIILYLLVYITFLSNTIHNITFRTIWAFIYLILTIISSYLIFYGVAKKQI